MYYHLKYVLGMCVIHSFVISVQDCFHYLRSLGRGFMCISELICLDIGIFTGTAMNLLTTVGSLAIFTILILILEHVLPCHLYFF